MWASGVIRCKGISRMRNALRVCVGEASLLSVRIWQPSEQMIEAAVLHHHKNYVVDRGARGVRYCTGAFAELLT